MEFTVHENRPPEGELKIRIATCAATSTRGADWPRIFRKVCAVFIPCQLFFVLLQTKNISYISGSSVIVNFGKFERNTQGLLEAFSISEMWEIWVMAKMLSTTLNNYLPQHIIFKL